MPQALCPVQFEDPPVALFIHLHGQMKHRPRLELFEEFHHAGIARQHLKLHIVQEPLPTYPSSPMSFPTIRVG